jgi:hypothetical protein
VGDFSPAPIQINLGKDSFTVSGNAHHMKHVKNEGLYTESEENGVVTRTFNKKYSYVDFREMGELTPRITVKSDLKQGDEISGYAYEGTVVNKYSGIFVPDEASVNLDTPNAEINEVMPGFLRRNTMGWFSNHSDGHKVKQLDLNKDGCLDFLIFIREK